jgi:hypothetical protein
MMPSCDVLSCCPLERTFGFLHVPNKGEELRPFVATTKLVPLTPFAPVPTRQVEQKDHDRKTDDRE